MLRLPIRFVMRMPIGNVIATAGVIGSQQPHIKKVPPITRAIYTRFKAVMLAENDMRYKS